MKYRFESRGKVHQVSVEPHGSGYQANVDGEHFELNILDVQPGQISLLFEGRPLTLYWAAEGGQKWVSQGGCTYLLEKPSTRGSARRGGERAGDMIRAPMPAQVRAVEVGPGESVEKGQTLLILEAMKMEIRLQAPRAGRVAKLSAEKGQTVDRDQVLVELESESGTEPATNV